MLLPISFKILRDSARWNAAIFVIERMSQLQRGVTGASRDGGHVVGRASDVLVRASMCLLNGCPAELCAKLVWISQLIGAHTTIDGDCGGI